MKMDAPVSAGLDPVVAVTEGMFQMGRPRLLKALEEVTPDQLHAVPAGLQNSIATLVLHIAATETKFAHALLGRAVAPEVKTLFKLDQPYSPLPSADGETLQSLQARLEQSLGYVKEALQSLQAADLERELDLGGGRIATVRWLLAILAGHQSQHLGQIQLLRRLI